MAGGWEEDYSIEQLNNMLNTIRQFTESEAESSKYLLGLRIENAERLHRLQLEQINKEATTRLEKEQEINERLIRLGYDARLVTIRDIAHLEEEREKEIQKLKAEGRDSEIDDVKKRYAEEMKLYKDNKAEIDKIEAARAKQEEKDNKKRLKSLKSQAQGSFRDLGDALFPTKEKLDELREQLKLANPDASDAEIEGSIKKARGQATFDAAWNALANFARQLGSTVNDIGNAKAEIDTRLYGSSNRQRKGSYWEQMSDDIVRHVGMSPYIKQADVVTNLKTLVSQGISFNVEQRAFLDTISDKIATTFESTDATLLKLVRIQQADTTAARLGMEAALTAFLNNMYETTEYMTDAAKEIRASLYEASALMGAAEATAFEYQVQKWMGSLYSVGFSNTSGLADALGKLAAGDIDAINKGGYGNLLIMAANRAGLSIAEILKTGLDDSETNQLMQAMVEYLGDIYAETKNSKVVAQQFANVYGLTASDLKAAANLYGSTNTIGRNRLDYGGMMNNLVSMANSMYRRTSVGESMTNVFENLKYATAQTMADDPILFATYTLATMLEDTTGGINLPAISFMGTGIDLETTVANLMRVGVMGAGLLGGIGKMLTGLGSSFSGSGMLRGFGIGDNLKTLTRGTGTGIAAISGASVSESGYAGNTEGGDVESKVKTDANDEGENQIQAKRDESDEITLNNIHEDVIAIYDLLQQVTDGRAHFSVEFDYPAGYGLATPKI